MVRDLAESRCTKPIIAKIQQQSLLPQSQANETATAGISPANAKEILTVVPSIVLFDTAVENIQGFDESASHHVDETPVAKLVQNLAKSRCTEPIIAENQQRILCSQSQANANEEIAVTAGINSVTQLQIVLIPNPSMLKRNCRKPAIQQS